MNNTMQKNKRKMEDAILLALDDFQKESGLMVTNISISQPFEVRTSDSVSWGGGKCEITVEMPDD
tara:strand:- start:3085 stop:3279 length:195 start_codon:yes stop_codon:yes gene_type:complete